MSATVKVPDGLILSLVVATCTAVVMVIVIAIHSAVQSDPEFKLKGQWTVLPQAEGQVEQVKCHYTDWTGTGVDVWLPANFTCPESLDQAA